MRIGSFDATLRRPVWLAAAASGAGALLFLAGSILRPPLGGLIALFVAVLIGAAIALLIRRPGVFLALFLAYATFAPILSRVVHLPLGWFKGTFFLLILPLWILSRAASPGRRSWARAARTPLLCYSFAAALLLVLGAVSALRGIPALQVLDALRGYLLYPPLLFVALEASGDSGRVRRFLWFILGLTGLVAAGAIVQSFIRVEDLLRLGLQVETGAVVFIAIDPISGKFYQRLFSILDDQSSVAAFAFVGIVLSLYLIVVARKKERIPLFVTLALNAYALLLTYNMTTLSGTVLFVLLLVIRRRSARLLAVFLLIAALIGGMAWLRYGDLIKNRLVTSFSLKTGVSTSLVVRVEENRQALKMLADEPVLGQGLGSTANAFVYYRLKMRSSFEGGFSADNFYMTTALEAGLLGLAAVLLLHLLPLLGLRGLGRSRDPAERAFAAVIGSAAFVLLLMNFSNGPMNTNPTNLLFWSLAGFAWRASSGTPRPGGAGAVR